MTTPQPQPEPRVSEKDWHAACDIICDIRDASARYADDADSGDILDALISHGWGPRPKVSAKELHDLKPPKVIRYLREHGIEVTYE